MGSVDFGETTILTNDDGNFGTVTSQQAALGTAGTLQTLSFYVKPGTALGHIVLGLYAESGGLPGAKLAQTAQFNAADAWNTQPVQTPVALAVGNYWLAYEYDDSTTLTIKVVGNGSFAQVTFTYNAVLPDPFGTPGTGGFHWSFYGTVSTPTAFNNRSNQLRRGILAANVKMLTFPESIRPRIQNVKSISRSLGTSQNVCFPGR